MKPITHVAIIVGTTIYSLPKPLRHGHVIRAMSLIDKSKRVTGHIMDLQGFLDEDGVFLDRQQAYKRVFEIGQELTSRNSTSRTDALYSEDVWNTPGLWNAPKGTEEYKAYWNIHGDKHLVSALRVNEFKYPEPPYSAKMFVFDLHNSTRHYIPVSIEGNTIPRLYSQAHPSTPECDSPEERIELIADRVFCLLNPNEELSENQPKQSLFLKE